MLRIGFLLGAGASFPFGIPMMREFYESFCDFIRANRSHCAALIDQLASKVDGSPDLETLIGQIERLRDLPSSLSLINQLTPEAEHQVALATELRGYLDMFIIETCESYKRALVRERLGPFVKLAEQLDAPIFSTNYDRLVEDAGLSVQLHCFDGFETNLSRPEARWNGLFEGKPKLMKLHGSVNWYEEDGSGTLYRLERGYSLPSHEYRLTHEDRVLRPLMIIPTTEKVVHQPPYAGLLTQFSDSLRELDVLVVIGNSLRDDHLRNTIIERAPGLELVLVNPAAENQRNIIKNPEGTHPIATGVMEFLQVGLGPLDELARSPANAALTPQHRRSLVSDYAITVAAAARAAAALTDLAKDQLKRLSSSSASERLGAVRGLQSPLDPVLGPKLRELAEFDISDAVRIAAIDTLSELDPTSNVEVLGRIATAAGSNLVRIEAALALRALSGYGPGRDEFQRVLEDTAADPDFEFLHPAADASFTSTTSR